MYNVITYAAETHSRHPSQTAQRHGNSMQNMRDKTPMESVLAAARAAQQVKHACTIDETELLALRPTLLKGYGSLEDHSR